MRKLGKKYVVLFIVVLFGGVCFLPCIGATNNVKTLSNTSIQQPDNIKIIVQNNNEGTSLQYQIQTYGLTPMTIDGKTYNEVTLGDEPNSLNKGLPDLPSISRSIIIPDQKKMGIQVTSSQYEEYDNILVAPSKGNILRTVNPDDVSYEFGAVYSQNAWFPSTIATLSDPYIIRDFRGQVVTITPFQYNPVEQKLRFYTDFTVEVSSVGNDDVNCIERTELPSHLDTDFIQIYEHHFINFNTNRYTPVEDQGNMLVITYDNFWNAMIPFVQWKNMKGIPTEMVNVSTIGNANAIKTFISTYYNTHGLTFVLLVGDAAQVPTLIAGGSASDPSYSYVVGSDHYPDLFVGRFSAETIPQVQTQVNRTIAYERDPQVGATWYRNGTGIASEYGVGDDGEYDYEHMHNIRTKLLNYTYLITDEFYGGSQGGNDTPGEPTPAMISTALSQGRGIINYCGHGDVTLWGTSGFNNNNVNALNNQNILPFIESVACYNGKFNVGTCFGEAWLRATHADQPTGAIGAFMSAISQAWNPPMDAQDESIDILVQSYAENKKTTFGGLMFSGCMHMNDRYGGDGYAETDAWTIFGDPSVQVRTDTPSSMTVEHDTSVAYGSTIYELDVSGVSDALCAISQNYKTLGVGYTDTAGHAVIQFFEPLAAVGYVDLLVTGYNKIPYQASLLVGNPDHAPLAPEKPQGPLTGKPGVTYLYRTSATDPDGDSVFLLWDWGDGNFSEWVGPFTSSQTATITHSWTAKGTYAVKVKAKDSHGVEGNWSKPLSIIMPCEKTLLWSLFHTLEQWFPRLYSLLIHLKPGIQ